MIITPDGSRLAMIDSGDNASTGWRPSSFIKNTLGRSAVDYLFVTNADQDHLSDLEGLWEQGIAVRSLTRNPTPDAGTLRGIKEQQGELTDDIERFLQIHAGYSSPVKEPFNNYMGGVTYSTFYNSYPTFEDTNNLSLAVFIKYGWFKILFPGDLEREGWAKLLENPLFVEELRGTTILVASHHGRFNGYNSDIFKHFTPRAVVISDKPIIHATQEMVPDYSEKVDSYGVGIINQTRRRHVLTTRRDGDITFKIRLNDSFDIYTSNG